MSVNIVYVLVALVLLWKGAEILVKSAANLAHAFGISQLIIGLTIVALGTSAPELVVTINAALRGHSNISVSNIIGSNIFNLGFIMGGVAMIKTIKTEPKLIWRDGMVLVAATSSILLFLWDLKLSRIEGIILFSGLLVYVFFLLLNKEKIHSDLELSSTGRRKNFTLLLLSMGMVLIGGHLLVHGSVGIANALGLSEWVIGVTIVAAGTSAPEFVTSLVAAIKGHHGLSIGTLIGSDLFNLLGVLGLAGIIRPLSVTPQAHSSMIMLVGMVFIVLLLLRSGWKLSRSEGCFLVCVNLLRWAVDFMIR